MLSFANGMLAVASAKGRPPGLKNEASVGVKNLKLPLMATSLLE